MAATSLVVGLGNALQGADGFGPAVLDRLRRADLPAETTLIDAGTDLLGHLDGMAAFERVILVDAFVGGGGTGAVSIVGEAEMSDWSRESPDSHAISPILTVGLFRRLYPSARTTIALVGFDAAAVDARAELAATTIAEGAAAVLRLLAACH